MFKLSQKLRGRESESLLTRLGLSLSLYRPSPAACSELIRVAAWNAQSANAVSSVHARISGSHRTSAALTCTIRGYHTSQLHYAQSSQKQPPPRPPLASASSPSPSATATALPSLEPVLTELSRIITRRYQIGELHRCLSPASRKILIAHKLPLEELLLHLPNNFAVYRARVHAAHKSSTANSGTIVSPPHLLPQNTKTMRLPPNAKPIPALAKLLGQTAHASSPGTATSGGAAAEGQSPTSTEADALAATYATQTKGTGFVNAYSTPLERLQEVIALIPNEWVSFTDLKISHDVKMRCMNFPTQRPMTFFLKNPKYFEVRMQDHRGHTFEVRRSMALQQQLNAAAPARK